MRSRLWFKPIAFTIFTFDTNTDFNFDDIRWGLSGLNIQVLIFCPDFSPKLRELTLYSMSGINIHISVYIYPLDPPPTRGPTTYFKKSYYKTLHGHNGYRVPSRPCRGAATNGLKTPAVVRVSIKLFTRYHHDKSSTYLNDHDKFSARSRALNHV